MYSGGGGQWISELTLYRYVLVMLQMQTLRKLNAYIGTIGNMEYLLPEHALNRLRTSLMKVGLSFGEIPGMEGSSGSFDLPLTRFGGRFGKDENTPMMSL